MPAKTTTKKSPKAKTEKPARSRATKDAASDKSRSASSGAQRSAVSLANEVDAVIATLKRLGTKRVRDDMGKRYGITGPTADTAFGVGMAVIQKVAKGVKGKDAARNHELAAALWETGQYEAQMVALYVDEVSLVTSAQMDDWCRGFDNWGICDTVCFKLFDGVAPDLVFRKIKLWARGAASVPGGNDEFVTRTAFALLACVALHNKLATDKQFMECLPLMERGAADERNFVKKGVSWALRGVGRRSPALLAASLALARRLAESEDAAPRWVGKDVIRDLERLG